nr:sporulation protein YabP [uncultured Cellulosilyticum sp.]
MDDKVNKKHVINMIDRQRLSITGVSDVFSFDENIIELETNQGYVDIKGDGLHIVKMSIDDGELIVEGMVDEVLYHDNQGPGKKKGSIISKLFK